MSRRQYGANWPRPKREEPGPNVGVVLTQQLLDARARGDQDEIAAADDRLDRYLKLIKGDGMPDRTAITKAQTGVRAAAAALAAFRAEAATGMYPDSFVREREASLRFAISEADRIANIAAAEYDTEARGEAASLRARADADRDPAVRMADELEYSRLVAGPLNSEEFITRAQALVKAGQPQRAELMVSVARAKGARVPQDLERGINVALDASDPDRKAALQIETEVNASELSFAKERATILGAVGVGLGPDGSVGRGSSSDVTRSSMAAKLAGFQAGETEFKVGDGSLSPSEEARLYHVPERPTPSA